MSLRLMPRFWPILAPIPTRNGYPDYHQKSQTGNTSRLINHYTRSKPPECSAGAYQRDFSPKGRGRGGKALPTPMPRLFNTVSVRRLYSTPAGRVVMPCQQPPPNRKKKRFSDGRQLTGWRFFYQTHRPQYRYAALHSENECLNVQSTP